MGFFRRITLKRIFLIQIRNYFTLHPQSCGETYIQHLKIASLTGAKLILAGIACLIHSIFPFTFTSTASTTVHQIAEELLLRKKNPLTQK